VRAIIGIASSDTLAMTFRMNVAWPGSRRHPSVCLA